MRAHLGEFAHKWTRDDASFEVREYPHQPIEGAITYVTFGLSEHVLSHGANLLVREELLFSCYERFSALEPADLLFLIGGDVLERHRGVVRGDVLGPAGPILPGVTAEALFCTFSPYFDESLYLCTATSPRTAIVALLPINRTEAERCASLGWAAFQDELDENQPDLLDLERREPKGTSPKRKRHLRAK